MAHVPSQRDLAFAKEQIFQAEIGQDPESKSDSK